MEDILDAIFQYAVLKGLVVPFTMDKSKNVPAPVPAPPPPLPTDPAPAQPPALVGAPLEEDPSVKFHNILCNAELKAVLGCDSIA
jgi:hypothetical protein